jgi:hypothetical protein
MPNAFKAGFPPSSAPLAALPGRVAARRRSRPACPQIAAALSRTAPSLMLTRPLCRPCGEGWKWWSVFAQWWRWPAVLACQARNRYGGQRRRAQRPAPGPRASCCCSVTVATTSARPTCVSPPSVVKRGRHNRYRIKRPGNTGTRHDSPATIRLADPVLTGAAA